MLTAAGVSPGEKFTHWTYGYTGAGGALRRLPQHLGDHGVCQCREPAPGRSQGLASTPIRALNIENRAEEHPHLCFEHNLRASHCRQYACAVNVPSCPIFSHAHTHPLPPTSKVMHLSLASQPDGLIARLLQSMLVTSPTQYTRSRLSSSRPKLLAQPLAQSGLDLNNFLHTVNP